jgi:hypothetical protein
MIQSDTTKAMPPPDYSDCAIDDARRRLYGTVLIVVVTSQVFGCAGLAAGVSVGALLAQDMLDHQRALAVFADHDGVGRAALSPRLGLQVLPRPVRRAAKSVPSAGPRPSRWACTAPQGQGSRPAAALGSIQSRAHQVRWAWVSRPRQRRRPTPQGPSLRPVVLDWAPLGFGAPGGTWGRGAAVAWSRVGLQRSLMGVLPPSTLQ